MLGTFYVWYTIWEKYIYTFYTGVFKIIFFKPESCEI